MINENILREKAGSEYPAPCARVEQSTPQSRHETSEAQPSWVEISTSARFS